MERGWNAGDVAIFDESVHADAVAHDPARGEFRGREAVKAMVLGIREMFPDLRLVEEDLIAAGDKVVLRWRATGTQAARVTGAEGGERRVEFTGVTIDRFSDGRIAESWFQWDSAGLMRQLTGDASD
jgi:predicted ester cyclase